MKDVCKRCGRTEEVTSRKAKCDCGGLWTLSYEPPKFDLSKVDRDTWSMFRYREFMPLLDDSWREITMGEGMTPVVPLDDNVLLKMDYFMPTLSFKDRGAAVLAAHIKAIGVERVVQDSSGNAGNSVAAYCGRAGIACDIYVPEGTSPKKITMIKAHGAAAHVIPGNREACANACRARVEEEGIFYASHVYNPFFYEGTKTYIYEVYEQLHRIPAHVFIPLGNGTLFIGAVKALEHLKASGVIESMPHLVAVQSERCAPFAEAAKTGERAPAHVISVPTLAEGIAIAEPMRGEEILEMIYRHGADVVTAPEDGILPAREALAKRGVFCEHTTAATYAAYLAYCKERGAITDALLPMCGAGLKSEH